MFLYQTILIKKVLHCKKNPAKAYTNRVKKKFAFSLLRMISMNFLYIYFNLVKVEKVRIYFN